MVTRAQGIKGSRQFKRIVREINENADGGFRKVAESVAQQVLAFQKTMVPVDQGDLQRALRYRVTKTGAKAQIGLLTEKKQKDFFYAKFLEFGTKGYDGTVRPGLADREPYNVSIPPMAPRPFLRPAFDLHKEKFIQELDEAFLEAVKKLTARRKSNG